MDLFNRKRVAELEKKLRDSKRERDYYIHKVDELAVKLDEVSKFEESIPEGCEKGPWCKACEFCRTFHYTRGTSLFDYQKLEVTYTCSKGKSCKNFVQKKENNDD